MDILSDIGSAFRSVAKELIKGGIYLYDTVSEVTLETGERFNDLVAEAKADLAKQDSEPPAQVAKEEADKDDDQDRGERKPRVHVRRSR